ncbi:MAG TPA: hypothetical protein VMX17_07870 [Candidatus Glassbacteria bacterium]|nr:hypothetical protein [Candidatus Glassbacteria bacterium]
MKTQAEVNAQEIKPFEDKVSCGFDKWSIAIKNNAIVINYGYHPGYVVIELYNICKGDYKNISDMFFCAARHYDKATTTKDVYKDTVSGNKWSIGIGGEFLQVFIEVNTNTGNTTINLYDANTKELRDLGEMFLSAERYYDK